MGNFVTGGYTATWNALALGQTREGYRPSHEFKKEPITGDLMAQTTQDAVYQGVDRFIQFELIEVNSAAVASLIEPYAATPGTPHTVGLVGQRDVGNTDCPGAAKPLILTRAAGLCAELSGPATITFPRAIIAANYPIEALLGPNLKRIPIRLRLYPDESGVFGTET